MSRIPVGACSPECRRNGIGAIDFKPPRVPPLPSLELEPGAILKPKMDYYTGFLFAILMCFMCGSFSTSETTKGYVISYGNKHLVGEITITQENSTEPVISYLKDDSDDDDTNKGKICAIATLNASILIRYKTTNNGIQEVKLEVPNELDAEGNCNESDQLVLKWSSFKLCFLFSQGAETWSVKTVLLTFNTSESVFEGSIPDETPNLSTDSVSIQAPLGKSYRCNKAKDWELKDGNDYSATLTLSDFKIQPYLENGPTFGEESVCSEDRRRRVDETVPIAVGSTLAIVSLSTVVAYAVYRYFKIKSVTYNAME